MAEAPKPNPSYMTPDRKKRAEDIIERAENEQAKKEGKHVEKVVKGQAKVKKKPAVKRMGEAIVGEDIQEVKSYLVWDVLLPAIKDTIAELVKKGIDAVLYGGASAPSNVRRRGNTSRPSYSDYYDRRRDDRRRPRKPDRRASHSFDDILFEDRFDAENVLSCLIDITMDYGMVSVADFYELAGEDPQYTDNKYGWGDLGDAQVVRTRDGYVIDLPRPHPID